MKNKMILIAGRSGAGKDRYADTLAEMGLVGVKSYTTRPKRYETEDTHIFISKEESDLIEDKVAVTKINDYEYFATKSQIEQADYYIIDPHGIRDLTNACPDVDFQIVYIYADYHVRLDRAVGRGDPKKELWTFKCRERSEDQQFTVFEHVIFNFDNVIIHNNNTDDIEKLTKYAKNDYMRFVEELDLSLF